MSNKTRAALIITIAAIAGGALLFRGGDLVLPHAAAADTAPRANALDTMFIVRAWDLRAAPRPLPEWFRGNRVQAHTRLSVRWTGRPAFISAAADMKAIGISVLTRHAKSGDESPMWRDSAVRDVPEGTAVDIAPLVTKARRNRSLTNALSAADSAGVNVIAYYWHMSDAAVARRNPGWVCRDAAGRPQKDPRNGSFLDITSPYREIILERLLALAARGADGFYFDADHMPHDGCWGTPFAAEFTRVTGQPAPKRGNFNDPVYRGFLSYQGYRVTETFAYLQNAVQQKYPNAVFVVSTSSLAALGNPQTTTDLARVVGSPKTEFMSSLRPRSTRFVFDRNKDLAEPPADVRIAFGWTMLRDAANGRPFHTWEAKFENAAALMAYTSAVLTYGGIANLNVSESAFGPARTAAARTELAGLKEAATLGRTVSPYLATARPMRWAAVHWSELARARRGADLDAAWIETIWPALGAFDAMENRGVPVGVVNDRQLSLGELDGYRVLFLPTPNGLTPKQREAVGAFRERGGVVIEQANGWSWTRGVPAGFKTRLDAQQANAPVRLATPTEGVHVVSYTDARNRTLIAVARDFAWVEARGERRGSRRASGSKTPRPPQSLSIIVKRDAAPRRIVNALSATPVTVSGGNGEYRIALPASRDMALIVIE